MAFLVSTILLNLSPLPPHKHTHTHTHTHTRHALETVFRKFLFLIQ